MILEFLKQTKKIFYGSTKFPNKNWRQTGQVVYLLWSDIQRNKERCLLYINILPIFIPSNILEIFIPSNILPIFMPSNILEINDLSWSCHWFVNLKNNKLYFFLIPKYIWRNKINQESFQNGGCLVANQDTDSCKEYFNKNMAE